MSEELAKKYPHMGAIHVLEQAWLAQQAAQFDVDQAALKARAAGWSWTAIGAAIGISRQGARKRYEGK